MKRRWSGRHVPPWAETAFVSEDMQKADRSATRREGDSKFWSNRRRNSAYAVVAGACSGERNDVPVASSRFQKMGSGSWGARSSSRPNVNLIPLEAKWHLV